MATASHQVVGLIDITGDAPWSADAIVRDCLGIPAVGSREDRRVLSGRVVSRGGCKPGRLIADMPRLQDDLDQLFEAFLVNSQFSS